MRGRKLGRNAAHRRAMFRNMANSLIRSVRVDEDAPNKQRVPGRIVTTVAKAKELRPFVEKLITMARKAIDHEDRAEEFATSADRGTDDWNSWRKSEQWNRWNQAIAPAVALRRRAFAALRNRDAVDILFDELAIRYEDRPGGYTRVVRLAKVRLGDAGPQALFEFVGERDRTRATRTAPVVDESEESAVESEEPAASETAASESEAESEAGSDSASDGETPDAEAADQTDAETPDESDADGGSESEEGTK